MTKAFAEQRKLTSTFASGEVTGTAVDIPGFTDLLFHVPSGFVGTYVTWQGKVDDDTFAKIVNSTPAEISTQITTEAWHECPGALLGLRSIRAIAASAQDAARTMTFVGMG